MTGRAFAKGTFILIVSGFLVKIFGFVYRIHLSNLIGAEGMGLFQLISPIYSLVILTLTSGVSIAVSKMTAAEKARKKLGNARRIVLCALALVAAAGTAVSVAMYLNIDFICNTMLKDSRTYYAILFLIPCIPIIASASVFKGYFYGLSKVWPTAVSQIAEQFVRISLVLTMAAYMIKLGIEYACMLAAIGMAFGEISNLAVLCIFYIKKDKNTLEHSYRVTSQGRKTVLKGIARISLPVSANRFVMSTMSAIEFILIPRMLAQGALDYSESIRLFGILAGMAMPIFLFPSPVMSSLSTSLIPAISEGITLNNYRKVNRWIAVCIQMTFLLGFIFTTIFITYSHEIADLFFKEEGVGDVLYMLSFSCILVYLQPVISGVLNGIGKQGAALRNSIIAYAIRISFLFLFVPVHGIKGYVWGMGISLAVTGILNFRTIINTTGLSVNIGKWIIRPGFACLTMLFANRYVTDFLSIIKTGRALELVTNMAGSMVLMLMLLYAAGAYNKKEILYLLKFKK
jgi:stage V sporulation protein B